MTDHIATLRETIVQISQDYQAMSNAVSAADAQIAEESHITNPQLKQMLEDGREPEDIADHLLEEVRTKLVPKELADEADKMAKDYQDNFESLKKDNNNLLEQRNSLERQLAAAQEEARQLKIEREREMQRQPIGIPCELNDIGPIGQENQIQSPVYEQQGKFYFGSGNIEETKKAEKQKLEFSSYKMKYFNNQQQDLYTSGRVLEQKVDFKFHYELVKKSRNFVDMLNRFPQIKTNFMYQNFLKSVTYDENVIFAVFADGKTFIPIMNENYIMHQSVSFAEKDLIFSAAPDLADSVLFVRFLQPCRFINFKGCNFAEIIVEAPNCAEEVALMLNPNLRKANLMECKQIKRAICDDSNRKLLRNEVKCQPNVKVGSKNGKGGWEEVPLQIVL